METRDVHVLGRQAVALHSQGKLAEAETLYRQVLAIDPRVYPALYLLGVVRLEQGDSAEAAGLIERALALNPGDPAAWKNIAKQVDHLSDAGPVANIPIADGRKIH